MRDDPASPRERVLLVLVLAVGAALRFHGLFHDLPFSYYGDEMHLVNRSMALGTGDLNPHWFHKPAFLMYLLLGCYGTMFGAGWLGGRFESPEHFGAAFLQDPGPFLLAGRLLVTSFSLALVYVTYRIGRRLAGAAAGLGAGLVTAALYPLVVESKVIKEDIPAAFFVALAALVFLAPRGERSRRRIAASGALAGAAMGMKYYGLVLIPAMAIADAIQGRRTGAPWGRLLGRAGLLISAFAAGFFVTSPYNLLDPTWSRSVASRIEATASAAPAYNPDAGVTYRRGLGAVPGAAVHFAGQLTGRHGIGILTFSLCCLGAANLAANARTRPSALFLAAIPLTFFLLAVVLVPYHAKPRHMNGVFPLLAVFVWPGASAVAAMVFGRRRASRVAAWVLLLLALSPGILLAVRYNKSISRPDARNVAHDWIVKHLPRDGGVLLDDYGPILQPNPAAVRRMEEQLAALPGDEAFTGPQAVPLALLRKYPPKDSFELWELGHQWWLAREVSDEELRSDWHHRDMGDPLIERTPRPLEEYRRMGIRYVVTNSTARDSYASPLRAEAFPSFYRFYDELARLTPMRSFEPREWGGGGPSVWIYDLGAAD